MPKVLVVEDDMFVAAQVAEALREHDFLVDHGATGSDARAYLSVSTYDLIILDWELPDATGLDICQEFRAASQSQAPILFLTARGSLKDKEQGFNSGADDYLTKPFHMSELLLRVQALLRRAPVLRSKALQIRDIILDSEKHEVRQNGELIEFFPKEYALLEFLMSHPNQIFSADALLQRIWSTDSESSVDTVRVTLMRIRQKLRSGEGRPLIVTLRNIGYRLEP